MKPNDTVERLVEQAKHRATDSFRQRARQAMFAALDETVPDGPQPLWRIIMTSRTTYYISALVAAAVVAFVLLPLGDPIDRQGVVLADVIKKAEGYDTLTHRERRACYENGKEKPSVEATVFKQFIRGVGIVERQYNQPGDKLSHIAYLLWKEKRLVIVFPSQKKYIEWPLSEKSLAVWDDHFSPAGLVKLMTRHGYKKLEPKEIDGQKVEGFETDRAQVIDILNVYNLEHFSFLLPIEKMTTRIWVDAETSLPVDAESNFTTGIGLLTGGKKLRCRFQAYDFQWGAKVDPKDFVPDIPKDYQRIDLTPLVKKPPVKKEKGEQRKSTPE